MEKWVLVVDDDEDVRETIVDVLTFNGYRTHAVADGLQALEKLRRAETLPALMVIDLEMPVMDGRQLIANLKKDARLAAVPYVIFSACADLAEIAPSLGAAGWMTKGESAFDLVDVVERHVPRAREPQSARLS